MRRPLLWVGRFRGHSSFAVASRAYVGGLIRVIPGLEVRVAPLSVLEPGDPFSTLAVDPYDDDLSRFFELVHHVPTTDPEADAYLCVTEYRRVPRDWVPCLEQAKLVVTQSTFCAERFAEDLSDPAKVRVVPYPLGEEFHPEGPAVRYAPADHFVVGSAFEWIPRKLPWLLLRAFTREFDPSESVALALRVWNVPTADRERATALFSQWGRPGALTFVGEPLPSLAPFYRGLDAYCSCTAGEGWGQTLSEAVACGVPVVAARHSGPLDFLNHERAYLVDVGDWEPVPPESTPPGAVRPGDPPLEWKLPDEGGLRRALRAAYEDWRCDEGPNGGGDDDDRRRSVAAAAAARLREKLDPARVARQLWEAIEPFL
ncbi:MAG: hypothetical protein Kow0069_15180 [Promethearchaeota archaeon]